MNVSISRGNSKMGQISSVSLPAGRTCVECECNDKCYAKKIERLRKTVREAYERNFNLLIASPKKYWREVEAAIMMSRFFRFHVSGDIPSIQYFENMVDVATRNPHCQILCFTKKYWIVNIFIDHGNKLPENLHIIFSAWRNYEMVNPHNLPEAHVRYKDGTTTAVENAKECHGNCSECATTDAGCWTLKNGEQVIFNEH